MNNFREPVTVELECPVEDMGQIVDRVTINRHLTGRDMLELDGLGELPATLRTIELLCGLPPTTTAQLFSGDIEAIAQALVPFVSRTRRAGKAR